ncbi:MAG: hypothetical protein J2P48_18230, partial [Alphaproteobacteria bacterium]|nr:hypothetical protein [Alphaproteobacteria bacterium]
MNLCLRDIETRFQHAPPAAAVKLPGFCGIGRREQAWEDQMADNRLLSRLPSRLHHNAYVVRDHETNRRFFEDLLGIPLVATWCEKHYNTEMQREVEFCHTFFGMADGSALAFFQFADPQMYDLT